ncbi:MAG: thioredoxin family protein [Bacteroidetes bacterium]|nr:MAG: thioredoxin family protein [Bacteroidota bacterium]
MKPLFTLLLCLLPLLTDAQVQLYDSWESAQKAAIGTDKDILIVLTGKEWCRPCKALEAEIMQNPEFIAYAQEHLVIFEVDVTIASIGKPNSKAGKLHKTYSEKHNAPEFPSMILTDQAGNEKLKYVEKPTFEAFMAALASVHP